MKNFLVTILLSLWLVLPSVAQFRTTRSVSSPSRAKTSSPRATAPALLTIVAPRPVFRAIVTTPRVVTVTPSMVNTRTVTSPQAFKSASITTTAPVRFSTPTSSSATATSGATPAKLNQPSLVYNKFKTAQLSHSAPIYSQPVQNSAVYFHDRTSHGSNWQQYASSVILYDALTHNQYHRQYYRDAQGDTASVILPATQQGVDQTQPQSSGTAFAAPVQQVVNQVPVDTQPAPIVTAPTPAPTQPLAPTQPQIIVEQVPDSQSGSLGIGIILLVAVIIGGFYFLYKMLSEKAEA